MGDHSFIINILMRAKEFINEGNTGSLTQDVADAIPSMNSIPDLQNQDAYKQYRMGLALAAARAVEKGEVEFQKDNTWGENMLISAYTEEGQETINMALKLMGAKSKLVTTKTSDEAKGTDTKSAVPKRKPNKYGV